VSAPTGAALLLLALVACSGQVTQNQPPEAPGAVSADPIPGGVRVVWADQSTNETEFIVSRSTVGGEEDDTALVELARVPTDGVVYEDFAVDIEGSYRYAVAATNRFGTSEQVLQDPQDPVSPGVGVRLTVTLDGAGQVNVLNGGQTVTCTSQCVVGLAQGSSVTLTAEGAGGLAFAGWAGACTMAGSCTFTVNGDSAVEARFTKLSLHFVNIGDSSVTADIRNPDKFGNSVCTIDTGQSCAFGFDFVGPYQVGVISARVEPQAQFLGYGGACTSLDTYCLIDVVGQTMVSINVVRVPVAEAKAYQGREDTTLSVEAGEGLLAGVVDTPGDSHQAVVVSAPATGSVTVAADGSFEYQPAQHANGQVTFEFAARDAHGNESAPRTATLTIVAVNDAPRFVIAGDPPPTMGNGVAVNRANFATGLDPGGGPDEAGQALVGFTITRTAGPPDLLSAGPTLAIGGSSATLSYTPSLGKFGTATFEAKLKDNGGTANGGADTSEPQTFTITVAPVTLTLAVTGSSGGGTIGRNPVGTANGANRFDYGWGTSVTLTASPASGSQFVAWGGACTGVTAQSCVLTLTVDTAASAEFVAVHTLTVTFATISSLIPIDSDPTGINNCTWINEGSAACNGLFTHGQTVTLTSSNNNPVLWSPPCPAGPSVSCQLTITAPTEVTVSSP